MIIDESMAWKATDSRNIYNLFLLQAEEIVSGKLKCETLFSYDIEEGMCGHFLSRCLMQMPVLFSAPI